MGVVTTRVGIRATPAHILLHLLLIVTLRPDTNKDMVAVLVRLRAMMVGALDLTTTAIAIATIAVQGATDGVMLLPEVDTGMQIHARGLGGPLEK